MSVAHREIARDLRARPVAASPARRIGAWIGWTTVFALAAVPGLVAVLLITHPDLFLPR